ncbi:hypothetical protein [Candidatus Formimonas warabiya]|nr:hypothetical protein [Candidatus Formimonas warabiya]
MGFSLQQNFMIITIPSLIAAFGMMVVQERYGYSQTFAVARQKQESGTA